MYDMQAKFKPVEVSNSICRKRRSHPLGKSPTLFVAHFSFERDGQPTIKFNINPDMLFVYRLIPRNPGLLGFG
jgi:hypothetical protein